MCDHCWPCFQGLKERLTASEIPDIIMTVTLLDPILMKVFSKLPQVRVAVNSRCGRACFYCRPSGEGLATKGQVELHRSFVARVIRKYKECGGNAVKLTGGDPALWNPLIESVREIKNDLGIGHVEVISRHPRIGKLAYDLVEAGADVINLSIDTLRQELHKHITGVNDLDQLLEATEVCAAANVNCKVNTVVMAGVNDHEIDDLIEFCERIGVRTLKLLDMIKDLEDGVESYANRLVTIKGRSLRQLYRPMNPITERLEERAVSILELHQGDLGHPMKALRMRSGLDVVIKDHKAGSWYGSICSGCAHYPCHDALMALRVTADHRLQFCLLRADIAIDLAPHLADGNANLEKAIEDALRVYGDAKLNEVKESIAV